MNTELCWLCSFFVLIVSVLFTIKPTNFEKPDLWIFEKHNQTSINSGSVFNFICYFQIALGLKNQMVVCLKFITKPQSTSVSWYQLHLVHLILNAKFLMWKTHGNVFVGHLGQWPFYPKIALDHERGGGELTDTF